jgi:DNA polymerase
VPCTKCPLAEIGISNCIDGRGEGGLLLVGQQPGVEDDLSGKPFVGASGQLLEAMLADAGLQPHEYRLTNAVRCRTPKIKHSMRAPEHSEMAACREHLIAEVRTHRPTRIIALGDTALEALCGVSGISGKRGQTLPLHADFDYACEVIPTWHPNYVLRVPNARATVTGDLRRVRDTGLEQTNIEWTHEQIVVGSMLAYDIETYDEAGDISPEMTQIALMGSKDARALVSSSPAHARHIVAVLKKNYRGTLISHFGWDFDDRKTGLYSDIDTAALAYIDDETQPLSLESLCVKYLGVRGWKEARDGAKLGTQELKVYNARDAQYTLQLATVLLDKLQERTRAGGVPRLRLLTDLLRPLRTALDVCSAHGIYVEYGEVLKAKIEQTALVERLREEVTAQANAALPPGAFDVQLKTKVRAVPFNPGSTLHVARVLREIGVHLPRTQKGKDRTDAETLERIDHPFAHAEVAWREASKALSTSILPYENAALSQSGRMYQEYTLTRTLTGRTSARRGQIEAPKVATNTQNLDRRYKSFFSAPAGKTLVRADYEQLEFWVAVWLAKIDRLITLRAEQPDFDPHRWFAAQLYGVSEEAVMEDARTKKALGDPNSMRQIAKSADFGLLYRGVEQTLIDYAAGYGITLSWDEAHRIVVAFHAAYPEFRPWWDDVRAEMITYGYVESPTGRRRNTGDARLLIAGGAFDEAWRQAVNALVQGFSTGDISELGLIAAHQAGLPVCGFIHDEILFEYDTERVICDREGVEREIRAAMIDAPVRILHDRFNVDFPKHLLAVDMVYVQR